MRSYETADEVFKRVDSIYQKAKRQDAEVFKEDIRLEPKIVYNVVEHLQGLAINFSVFFYWYQSCLSA